MPRTLPATLASAVLSAALVLASCASPQEGGAREEGAPSHEHDEASPVADGARRVEVGSTSFEFEPSVITVTAGEDVAISLSSDDILHDFTIDEVDVHVAADRGETVDGGLRVDEPGTYTYYCTVPGHREAGMEGTLVVEAAT